MFREFMGLPLHALVVHAAVVFIPLQVLAALLYAFVPALRRYVCMWWIVLGLAVVGPAVAWVARLSGNEYKAYWLEHGASGTYLANLDVHQGYGNNLSLIATGLGVVMLVMVLVVIPRPTQSSDTPARKVNPVLTIATQVVVVGLAIATAYYVFKTGDAGARLTHPNISGG